MRHRFIISLGSNTDAKSHIPRALEALRQALVLDYESAQTLTKPVDFPYPSGYFTNVLLRGSTELEREAVYTLLHQLEQTAGRTRETPALVPLDADLIIWDDEVLKPKDIERPYFKDLLPRE